MNAVAISNNDMVYLHWHVAQKIDGCLGFTVIRHDSQTGESAPIPAMVGFPGAKADAGKRFKTTNDWPVQKFAWKDLFATRGRTYWYEIIPMIGTPGNLRPDRTRALRTNAVTLSPDHGSCKVFFNRGIISTQAIAKALPKGKSGLPNSNALKKAIIKDGNAIRNRLMGDLQHGVLSLFDGADGKGSHLCALYELSDAVLVDKLIGAGKKKVRVVLSNAGADENSPGLFDDTNLAARKRLHDDGFDVTDRMLKRGYIGHNKFVVYQQGKTPKAVLTGSTNWTATGLCAQSNNAIVIDSPELAKDYAQYWSRLLKDTEMAGDESGSLQGAKFRTANIGANPERPLVDAEGHAAGTVRVWFSPNTKQRRVPKSKPAPPDLKEVFSLIEQAKQGILFLAFIPGNPSVVSKMKEVYDDRVKSGKLFYLRGAATSPDPATAFHVQLYHRSGNRADTVRPTPRPRNASAEVSSVAGIFSEFAYWEAEIYKLGHAVIHDKVIVIDPFTDNSVVVTGSHNLGYKASYSNDENMLIIKGNRSVASAYAAHVLDVYEHYRWRWRLQAPIRAELEKLKQRDPDAKPGELWQRAIETVGARELKRAWQSLCVDDSWQDYYQTNKKFLAAENNFWSAFGGEGLAD